MKFFLHYSDCSSILIRFIVFGSLFFLVFHYSSSFLTSSFFQLRSHDLYTSLWSLPTLLLLISQTDQSVRWVWLMSDSLWPHIPQHARVSCPSRSHGVCTKSHPSSHQCHLNISSSVAPFFFCLQSFPASGSFPMSEFLHKVAKELELQHQSFQWIFRVDYLRIDWFDLLEVQGTLKNLLQHHHLKVSVLWSSAFFMVLLLIYTCLLEKPELWPHWLLSAKWYLCFLINMLSKFVITLFPRSKSLLISWLDSTSMVILEPKEIKPVTTLIFSSPIGH